MKPFLCFLATLCLYGSATGQVMHPHELKVGALVPDLYFKKVVNHSIAQSNLYPFRKKLLLLNFWATNCAACIRELPTLDSIQKANAKDFSILLISTKSDTKEKVDQVFSRIKATTGNTIDIPVILSDTMLGIFFPHQFIPHFAWLDSNFKIIAITGEAGVSTENLLGFIRTYTMPVKNTIPLTAYSPEIPDSLIAHSSLRSYLPAFGSATYIIKDSKQQVTRVSLVNQPLVELIKRAYGYFNYPSHVEYPPGEAALLNYKGKTPAWIHSNSYTYELLTPPTSYERVSQLMREDIKRYFGYTAQVANDTLFIYHQK